jgi:hypothetical protein
MPLKKRHVISAVLAALFLAAAAYAAWQYRLALKLDSAPEVYKALSAEPSKPRLGQNIHLDLTIKCPWNRRPATAELIPGEGMRVSSPPSISFSGLGTGYALWRVSAAIVPFRTGSLKPGEIRVGFRNNPLASGSVPALESKIASMEVLPLELGDSADPELANAIAPAPKSRYQYYLLAAAVLVIIGTLVLLFLRRRRKRLERPLPPWLAACLELDALRKALSGGAMNPERCLSKLTDIVRTYLEKRFQLRAPRQTTSEFLRDIDSVDSPLDNSQRGFLKEFLSAADLVKFAGMPADNSIIKQAIDKAETLVNETKPASGEELS